MDVAERFAEIIKETIVERQGTWISCSTDEG